MLRKLLITLVLAMALCVPAYATTTIDFNINAPTTGSISFAGIGNPLVGTNIPVEEVKVIGFPEKEFAPDTVFLNFATGPWVSSSGDNWVFSGGGTISITNYLTGSFTGATVVDWGGSFKVLIAGITDTKTDALFDFLGVSGLPNAGWTGNINLSFEAIADPQNKSPFPFTSTQVLSGDVVNSIIPIPPSALLLGSGLLGLLVLRGRRQVQ